MYYNSNKETISREDFAKLVEGRDIEQLIRVAENDLPSSFFSHNGVLKEQLIPLGEKVWGLAIHGPCVDSPSHQRRELRICYEDLPPPVTPLYREKGEEGYFPGVAA